MVRADTRATTQTGHANGTLPLPAAGVSSALQTENIDNAHLNNPAPACKTCGKFLTLTSGQATTALVDEESARCARLREITQQRQALASRAQAGITGVLGSDTMDTVDMVAQRRSMNQLDVALKAEAGVLVEKMLHTPEGN